MSKHVRQQTLVIRQFITEMVNDHPNDIARLTAEHFNISRQAAWVHLRWMVTHRVLRCEGNTTARIYELLPISAFETDLKTSGLEEDRVWSHSVAPLLKHAPENVIGICATAFTEMLNNVIDHSGSDLVSIKVLCTAATVSIKIHDRGIGIFKKIKDECDLADERDAILELGKGLLTTAPAKHSGYGIYFTSRAVDLFALSAGKLLFTHIQPDDDWLMELDREPITGTHVDFVVSMFTDRTSGQVWDRFCASPDTELGFTKTHVPIRLAQYGNEHLISRSQAKRVLTRFEKFREVLLDFKGVVEIGQAFADEIFRVFASEHPDIKIAYKNVSHQVAGMIGLAQAQRRQIQTNHQKSLFDE